MKITILGTGTFATALSELLNENSHDVIMYGIEESEVNDLNNQKNEKYFKGVTLHKNTKATLSLVDSLVKTEMVIFAVPTTATARLSKLVYPLLESDVYIVNTGKGLDLKSKERISTILRKYIPDHRKEIVSLIGPGFATEIVEKQYTTVAVVSKDIEASKFVQTVFSNSYFRVYTSDDEVGCELGVSLKNILAIASGILSGHGAKMNTKASLITRGIREIMRFGMFFGGKAETFMGLCGLGDLVLTALSEESRNYRLGLEIGKANNAIDVLKNNTMTVEGVKTCAIVHDIAHANNIDMPIVDAIYNILFNGSSPLIEIKSLMDRDLKSEF